MLGNCEVAGEEKKRPEVFRLMTTNIGMVEFVVDLELNASPINQRLHPLSIFFCQEAKKLINDVVAACANPIIVGFKFQGILAAQGYLDYGYKNPA